MPAIKPVSRVENRNPALNKRFPLARLIIIFSALIMLANCVVIILRGESAYETRMNEEKAHAQRLLHVMFDHVELTFLAVDLTLRRAVERQYFNALFGGNLIEDMRNQFALWVKETPQITAMFMTNAKGDIIAMSTDNRYNDWLSEKMNIAHRDYFRAHADSDDTDLLFIQPHESDKKEGEFFVMSRRVTTLNGSFGGIVVAVVNTAYLLDFFNSLETDKSTRFAVFTGDRTFLINQSRTTTEATRLNEVIDEAGLGSVRVNYDTLVSHAMLDPNLSIFALSFIPHLTIGIAVILDGKDILAPWWQARQDDIMYLGIFALFVAGTVAFTAAFGKQIQRVERSEQAAVLASQAKSEFLANMSHELRTPLNAVIGFSEMLSSGYFGKLNAKQKERIDDVNLCGTHLLELINDILAFSKGDAGKLELREESVSIPLIAEESIRIVGERAKQTKLRLINNIPQNGLPKVRADRRKMKQILLNLLSNSIKFTPENGRVEITAQFNDDKNLELIVTDTGIGMKEEDIPKALSVFGQVHRDPAYGGTGLGLPLSKMFAELHGGALDVRSLEGVGTRVIVTLPADRLLWSSVKKEASAKGNGGGDEMSMDHAAPAEERKAKADKPTEPEPKKEKSWQEV